MKIISDKALFLRLKRKLSKEGLFLRKARGAKNKLSLGEFFTVDEQTNIIVNRKLNLESYGRYYGVLKSEEIIEN